jgi:hypothetical protein
MVEPVGPGSTGRGGAHYDDPQAGHTGVAFFVASNGVLLWRTLNILAA